ncbi:MAG: ABC transporter substrate-binding protein [Clostridia bacterium]|nr:ABC transporter substrate-binding protein [Clostridia bacterium]
MKRKKAGIALFLVCVCLAVTGCMGGGPAVTTGTINNETRKSGTGNYLSIVTDEADTTDPQCTSEFYNIALNVFDRLTEIRALDDGTSEIVPSLAKSWTVSDDGLTYSFHLQENVKFSNGENLTASDVLYTFTRLLTYPDSCNQDIAEPILGARDLMIGEADTLAGFRLNGDYDFTITLEQPYAAFLAGLSTPGASILDETTTAAAGSQFGLDPALTIGTGPFIFREWQRGVGMVLEANRGCWSGAPKAAGLNMVIVPDSEAQRLMFENGELDILDLDTMGPDAEYFVHGDLYQNRLVQGPRVGISYIALNQSIPPLDQLEVRRAMQLSLDRQTLLNAVYSGRGQVENGIFPHGLIGFNPSLPQIPYDLEEAKRLLAEAGYPDGISVEFALPASSTAQMREQVTLIVSMWEKAGIHASVAEMSDEDFMARRKSGGLTCYTSTWSADFNDPDNFIHTFFGTAGNTLSRSLCLADETLIQRVHDARAIVDEGERIREYQALEKEIIQEQASWVPLFSKQHLFVVQEGVTGFKVAWNGWSNTCYRDVAVEKK